MFQSLLRNRVHDYVRNLGDRGFRARSAERDAETDRARASSILGSIEQALDAAEREHAGLSRRVEDVLARAAVTMGNGDDEYLERDAVDSHHQDLFGTEISNGQRRLQQLATEIANFRFLRAAALSRLSDSRATASPRG
jgi:hypothetical protein